MPTLRSKVSPRLQRPISGSKETALIARALEVQWLPLFRTGTQAASSIGRSAPSAAGVARLTLVSKPKKIVFKLTLESVTLGSRARKRAPYVTASALRVDLQKVSTYREQAHGKRPDFGRPRRQGSAGDRRQLGDWRGGSEGVSGQLSEGLGQPP